MVSKCSICRTELAQLSASLLVSVSWRLSLIQFAMHDLFLATAATSNGTRACEVVPLKQFYRKTGTAKAHYNDPTTKSNEIHSLSLFGGPRKTLVLTKVCHSVSNSLF